MGSMASGMATGVGMGMAQRAMDGIMGPRQVEHVHTGEAPAAQPVKCQFEQNTLNQCLQQQADASACNPYIDMLKRCQQA